MDEDEYRDLLERGQAIAEITSMPGWTYLIDRANVQRAAKQKKLVNGGCKTHEEYIAETEWLKGAQFILDIPEIVNTEIGAQRRVMNERAEPIEA